MTVLWPRLQLMRGLDCRPHLEAKLFMLMQWRVTGLDTGKALTA